jgi:hypothetical protein
MLEATLDALVAGVYLVAYDGRVVYKNAAAERQIRNGNALSIVGNRLLPTNPETREALLRAIGSAENGRYVIVGLKLANADGAPVVTRFAFSADQFDRFLIQLLDNAARARNDRLKSNPRPEDAVLNIEAAALPVVSSSAEPSAVKEGRRCSV